MKRKFLILLCLVLFIVSVSCVSAAENTNQTVDGISSVSTIDNIDQTNDTLGVFENVEELSAKDDGTFTALQEKINNAPAGSTITLENDYKYDADFDKNGILIDKKLSINGNGYTIDGSNRARIFNGYGQGIVLNNINFFDGFSLNGGAIYARGDMEINNCNFDSNEVYTSSYKTEVKGGAIYSTANLILNNCIFTRNSVHANGINGDGDAIFCDKKVTMNDCYFEKNSEYVNIFSHMIIAKEVESYNSSFNNNRYNRIISSSGLVYMENCSFENNGRSSSDKTVSCGELNLDKCSFINNTLSFNGGGNIQNCIFTDNAGIDAYARGSITIQNCDFNNNSIAAIKLDGDGSTNIQDCIFTHNSVNMGIIQVDGKGSKTIRNCDFNDNSAKSNGIISLYKDAVITDCNFVNNSNPSIYFTKKLSNFNPRLSNLDFDKNNDYGGGISVEDNFLIIEGVYQNYRTDGSGIRYYYDVYITGDIVIDISGKICQTTFDSKGKAKVSLEALSAGVHNTKISYGGDSNFASFEMNLPITTESSTVLEVPDVTKDYGGSEQLQITLTESGSPVANAKVNININKNDYTRTTDANGKASMPINLNAGTYDATVTYKDISTTAKVIINKLNTKNTLSYNKNSHNSFTLTALIDPSTASGDVVFTVNGKDYSAKVNGGKATYTLNNLAVGLYSAVAKYNGDVNHKESSSSSVKFTVEEYSIIVSAPDVTKYYGGDERFVVTVTDNAGNPVSNEPVKVTINDQLYDRKTGADGRTTFAINLRSGTHEATTEHAGDVIKSTITVKTTVVSKNITKIFRNGTNYEASFLDKKGNKAPAGEKVSININGVFYHRTIKSDGSISFALNLEQGTYVLTLTNPYTGEEISNTVTILPNIVDNKDLVKYYRNGSQFTFKLLNDEGKPVAGQKASININGVFYTRTTNDKGIATFQINLEPGTYILTMEYKGCRVSNRVTVLSVIQSSDIKMKYQDGTRFKVTILDGVGKPYANQNVTFNINGVFYYRTTNNDGSASLAINLMAGEYIITTTYNSLNVSNKVTIAG